MLVVPSADVRLFYAPCLRILRICEGISLRSGRKPQGRTVEAHEILCLRGWRVNWMPLLLCVIVLIA